MGKKIKGGPAEMDFINLKTGKVFGSVASTLLNNGLNPAALRTNDTLLYDEWKEIDKAVLKAYQERLVGVADLQAAGLTYGVGGGLGKTVLGYQDASDTEDAELNMDGVSRGARDRPEFDISYLPLPIVHKDFSFSIREIEASRNGNMPLDTTMAELAARKVAERIETMLFLGASTYTFGGGSIYGYTDEPNRNTGSLTGPWDDSAQIGTEILSDVLAMKQALIDDRAYGPYMLYIPTNFEATLDEDFKANSDKSLRERIANVAGITGIQVADKLTDDNVLLVQMTSDVVRLVNGLSVTTVQWESEGGMRVNFKVMAIQVPQTRHDQDGRCGIVHYT
jgi:uncharacterized linocin/CFP29 family protein